MKLKLIHRQIIIAFQSFLFPVGIWLGLQGYDIASGVFLTIGFIPLTVAALVILTGDINA